VRGFLPMGSEGPICGQESTRKWARFGIDSDLKRCQERRAAGMQCRF
jgi:hypothetical protein